MGVGHPHRCCGVAPRAAVPSLLGTRDRFHGRQFSMDPRVGDGFQMIQAHYVQVHLLLRGRAPNRPRAVPVLSPEGISAELSVRAHTWACGRCRAVCAGPCVHPHTPVSVFSVRRPAAQHSVRSFLSWVLKRSRGRCQGRADQGRREGRAALTWPSLQAPPTPPPTAQRLRP